MDEKVFRKDTLKKFICDVLCKVSIPKDDAVIVADNLLKSELWGISTHGISRLSRYIMRLENGTIATDPLIEIKNEYPSVLSVDGQNGLGSIVMEKGLKMAIERAKKFGICVVGVKNSNHFGMAGYYCALAAEHNMVSIGFTNSLAAMAPWGGKSACLGTNPLAFGFPRKNKKPIIADMATSVVARGKILLAAKKGTAIPDTWALDENGKPTTDAQAAAKGFVLPMAGPKGYALSLIIDCLSGVLTGAAFAGAVGAYKNDGVNANIGHLFIVMKPDVFVDEVEYENRIEEFCAEIRMTEKADGVEQIYMPGEREQILEERLLQKGIRLSPSIEAELIDLSRKYHIPLAAD